MPARVPTTPTREGMLQEEHVRIGVDGPGMPDRCRPWTGEETLRRGVTTLGSTETLRRGVTTRVHPWCLLCAEWSSLCTPWCLLCADSYPPCTPWCLLCADS